MQPVEIHFYPRRRLAARRAAFHRLVILAGLASSLAAIVLALLR